MQNATESAAEESGSYHTKEVIDRLGYSYVVTDAKLQGRPVLVFGIRERRTEKSFWFWPTGQRIKMAPYKIRNGGMLVGKFQLNPNSGTNQKHREKQIASMNLIAIPPPPKLMFSVRIFEKGGTGLFFKIYLNDFFGNKLKAGAPVQIFIVIYMLR